jgi:ribosomal protein L37AE/L43A
MEIKACEHCGSFNTSEDLSTNIIICMKCGKSGKGKMTDINTLVGKNKSPRRPQQNPFNINNKININYSRRIKL